jgi:hypothetical protein
MRGDFMKKLIIVSALAATLQAASFDGNGALEAFYIKPAHHSVFKSKVFWISVGVTVGAGLATGYMLTRQGQGPRYTPVTVYPTAIVPTVDVINHIGVGQIGGGVPVGKVN